MKVLIVGGGGREHALAWKCAQSDRVTEVIVAPGNAGTALEDKVRNAPVKAEDIDGLLELAKNESAGLTIIGPEVPLVEGIVDRFQAAGMPCFGPSAAAAQLEGSKAFTKDFLYRHNIPTAAYQNFNELEPALAYIRQQGAPIVIKADGLAAGKGVIVAQTLAEAEQAATRHAERREFRRSWPRVVVEEFLEGEEASFIVITDGDTVLPLATFAGPQSARRWRYRPEHRRHGRVLAGSRCHRRNRTTDPGSGHSSDAGGPARRWHYLRRLSCMRD